MQFLKNDLKTAIYMENERHGVPIIRAPIKLSITFVTSLKLLALLGSDCCQTAKTVP